MENDIKEIFMTEYNNGLLQLNSTSIYNFGKRLIMEFSYKMTQCKNCIAERIIYEVEKGFRLFIRELIVLGNKQAKILGEKALLKQFTDIEHTAYNRYLSARNLKRGV